MTLFFPDLNVWLAATRSRGARTHACPFLQPTQRNERWGGPPGPRPWSARVPLDPLPQASTNTSIGPRWASATDQGVNSTLHSSVRECFRRCEHGAHECVRHKRVVWNR